MSYQLNLNLQQRTAVRAAISFWENKEVKDKVKEFFMTESCHEVRIQKSIVEWRKFTKTIVESYFKNELPKKLKIKLIHIVKMIGETKYNWYEYIKYGNKSLHAVENNGINYIDKIYWTPYGTVDEVETFKSSWITNPIFNIAKVYDFACEYALEEYIHDLWHKIPSDIQKNCYIMTNDDIRLRYDRHILVYWKYHRDNDLPNLMRYLDPTRSEFIYVYNRNLALEENMLRLSVHEGYNIAMRYFWNKLTEEQRNRNVLGCARISVEEYVRGGVKNYSFGYYKKGQFVEICIFLLNQMTTADKKSFFNEIRGFLVVRFGYIDRIDVRNEILKMLLFGWPWQELFMPVLKNILQFQDRESRMTCMFLSAITNKMVEDHSLGYALETSKYQSLLREAWLIAPGFIKQNIPKDLVKKYDERIREYNFIFHLIDMWDIDSLKLILDDPAIAAVRDQFINLGLPAYQRFIFNDQFEKLDQLIEEIFSSKEEKESFKQTINVLHSLIEKDLFHLVDKLLDWQCVTFEEKQSIKNNIDHMGLCKNFIEMEQYDKADNLLSWKFETEEERKKCKDHFNSDVFSIKRVCEIWQSYGRDIENAKEKSSKFLRWLLESEEEIARFKKGKIDNFETDELLINYLFELDRIENINDFLNWCSLSKKVIKKIKRFVSDSERREAWMIDNS